MYCDSRSTRRAPRSVIVSIWTFQGPNKLTVCAKKKGNESINSKRNLFIHSHWRGNYPNTIVLYLVKMLHARPFGGLFFDAARAITIKTFSFIFNHRHRSSIRSWMYNSQRIWTLLWPMNKYSKTIDVHIECNDKMCTIVNNCTRRSDEFNRFECWWDIGHENGDRSQPEINVSTRTQNKGKCAILWKVVTYGNWFYYIASLIFLAPIICYFTVRTIFTRIHFSSPLQCFNVFDPRVWYFIVLMIQQICILKLFALYPRRFGIVCGFVRFMTRNSADRFPDEITATWMLCALKNGKFIHIRMNSLFIFCYALAILLNWIQCMSVVALLIWA